MENRCEKSEKRLGYIIVLGFMAFMFIASKCAGQCIERSHRYINDPQTVTYSSCELMSLPLINKTGTISVGIIADQNAKSTELTIYVYYTKEDVVNADSKTFIGFPNGDIIKVIQTKYDSELKYAEFRISSDLAERLKKEPFNYLCFSVSNYIHPSVSEIKNPSYFKDFLTSYTKRVDVENISHPYIVKH